jgi:ABC-2 type transport system ATP-binding protein
MVCDRVAIMVQGKVLRQGTVGELTAGKGGYTITTAEVLTDEHRGVINAAADGLEITIDPTRVHIQTTDPAQIQPAIDALRRRGVIVSAVTPVRVSLEDLFMETVEADESHGRPGAAKNADKNKKGARP